MLKKEVVLTSDGSSSIYLPDWDESYHSKHGAIQEAKHVFIESGFQKCNRNPLHILEIGFGTGLNAFLTLNEAILHNKEVFYTGIEAYPVSTDIISALNYPNIIEGGKLETYFKKMHESPWEKLLELHTFFKLTKRNQFFQTIEDVDAFDLIYFDAFGFRVQQELWSETIFQKMYNALKKDGILVTYACRTPIKKAMEAVGFTTEKLPGPPGKREMLRACK